MFGYKKIPPQAIRHVMPPCGVHGPHEECCCMSGPLDARRKCTVCGAASNESTTFCTGYRMSEDAKKAHVEGRVIDLTRRRELKILSQMFGES